MTPSKAGPAHQGLESPSFQCDLWPVSGVQLSAKGRLWFVVEASLRRPALTVTPSPGRSLQDTGRPLIPDKTTVAEFLLL